MSPIGFGTTSTEDDRFRKQRARMVERQLRRRGITDDRVLAAMSEVPRERFVPRQERGRAYRDGALRIGEGQTISQPWIVACMASLLELKGHERVLEVGTGSGYGAAVLSRLARVVVSVERVPALADAARTLLAETGHGNVEVRLGDGSKGAPDKAPFEGISVTATAEGDPPPALFEQLAPHGSLACPVRRGEHELLMRFRDGREESVAPVRFVPLLGPDD